MHRVGAQALTPLLKEIMDTQEQVAVEESPAKRGPKPKSEKSTFRKVRKKVFVEEEVEDIQDPQQYEMVTFRFWNEEQKGIPVDYEWVDKWTRRGECKGIFRDGQLYTVPRVAFEYYRDNCSMPLYKNVDQELVPGQFTRAAKEVGRTYRFRLEVVR